MLRDHLLIKLPLLLVLFGLVEGSAIGGDPVEDSEKLLKGKGLSKTHATWLIEDEKPVLASMKEARAVFQSYAQVADRQAEAVQMAQQSKMLDAQRKMVQANLNEVNQQVSAMPKNPGGTRSRNSRYYQQTAANNPLLAQQSELKSALSELNQTQNVLKSRIPQPKDKASLDAEVAKRFGAFKDALTDLRKQIDDVSKKYSDLAADESVKKAIDDLTKTTKAKIKLGPSEPFLAMMKEVDQAEHRYLGKTDPAPAGSTKKSKARAKK